jgi:hypothetical protein
MWHRVVLVKTDVSEEHIVSIIGGKTIRELGGTLTVTVHIISPQRASFAVTSNFIIRMTKICELTRATRRNIQEDGNLHSGDCCELNAMRQT